MKKLILLLLITIVFISCNNNITSGVDTQDNIVVDPSEPSETPGDNPFPDMGGG